MIALLAARFGIKISERVAAVIVVAGLFALGGLGIWRGLAAIERLTMAAADAATEARDAHWRAEIEKSNAEVQKRTAEQAINAAAASAAAEAEITRLRSDLTEMETRNAALPDGGARGLGRDRVRLLTR